MRNCDLGPREVRIVRDARLDSYVDVLLRTAFVTSLLAVLGYIYLLLTYSTNRLNLPKVYG